MVNQKSLSSGSLRSRRKTGGRGAGERMEERVGGLPSLPCGIFRRLQWGLQHYRSETEKVKNAYE